MDLINAGNALLNDLLSSDNIWLLYLCLIIGPFIQEDTAVIGAAGLSLGAMAPWQGIFAAIFIGLVASDSWKYWLGWAAKRHQWAKKYAARERITKMRDAVREHAVKTLIVVRFLPFARIPTYVACGFFGISYLRYWIAITISAFLYITAFFLVFHILGELVGEHLKAYMAMGATGLLVFIILTMLAIRMLKARNTQKFIDPQDLK